ncbi:MAG: ABC transporter permease, partial [Methylobacter sp.]
TITMLVLKQPVEKLSGLYDGAFHILFLGFMDTLTLLAISSMLGIAGSWIVLHFQLQRLKPE